MTRYIFITGGVVSSLGKGLIAASLGALLQARGYHVRLRKLDPYLNVDPGTMSPFEHGEVFVTDDGAETDLDIGHYERFTGVAAKRTDSVSSGGIYSRVLKKERDGKYLGETIQVIPHVTNEIKEFIRSGDENVDFMICEIGGTIGDIEGLPFLEAIRQFGQEGPPNRSIFLHATLVPYIEACDELKTKPTQHSVKELRSIGISPDVLVCRSEHCIPDRERDKIALFCNVRKEFVISAPDLKSIYDAPLSYHEQRLDNAVISVFGIDPVPKPDLREWERVSERIKGAEGVVKIVIVGKYTGLGDAYKSIDEALTHGGIANEVRVKSKWIEAEIFESEDPAPYLEDCDAILVPGGFGERGSEGKINAAKFARERRIPFFGICLGMQMAVIEMARSLIGVKNAGSEEFDHEAKSAGELSSRCEPIVYHMNKWRQEGRKIKRDINGQKGATMRLGAYPAVLDKGSRVAGIYSKLEISERHRHRYEIDMKYRTKLRSHGVEFSGVSPDGKLPEVLEISDHPWFVGVQFHPELKSRPFKPHPLFADFIRAAIQHSRLL